MRIAVYILVFDKGRVLALKEDANLYRLPKAILRQEETMASAAQRGLRKETGIEAAELHFTGIYDALDRNPHCREIGAVLLARWWRDPPLSRETHEIHWVENFASALFAGDQNVMLSEQGIFAPLSSRETRSPPLLEIASA